MEVKTFGRTPRGEQPATDSGVATSVPDGAEPVDTTQEEEQAAAESEAGKTFQGGVGKEWTAEEEEELTLLLAENLAEAGSSAKRALDRSGGRRTWSPASGSFMTMRAPVMRAHWVQGAAGLDHRVPGRTRLQGSPAVASGGRSA